MIYLGLAIAALVFVLVALLGLPARRAAAPDWTRPRQITLHHGEPETLREDLFVDRIYLSPSTEDPRVPPLEACERAPITVDGMLGAGLVSLEVTPPGQPAWWRISRVPGAAFNGRCFEMFGLPKGSKVRFIHEAKEPGALVLLGVAGKEDAHG